MCFCSVNRVIVTGYKPGIRFIKSGFVMQAHSPFQHFITHPALLIGQKDLPNTSDKAPLALIFIIGPSLGIKELFMVSSKYGKLVRLGKFFHWVNAGSYTLLPTMPEKINVIKKYFYAVQLPSAKPITKQA